MSRPNKALPSGRRFLQIIIPEQQKIAMKRLLHRLITFRSYLLACLIAGVFSCVPASVAFAADQVITETTDLSTMDFSDAPSQESNPAKDGSQLIQKGADLSGISWEDEEGDAASKQQDKELAAERLIDEAALAKGERRIHFWGFLMFMGYIIGCILTGFFTRNRKLAVEYPPELLILLHSVWPLEWIFMLFAGKKVR